MTTKTTQAVQERPKTPLQIFADKLEQKKPTIRDLLPKGRNVDRFIKSALLAVSRDYKLKQCSINSLLMSVVNAAETDLEFTPAKGHAFLVPFWNAKKRCLEAQFIPGYRGLIYLSTRTGTITRIDPDVVFENDTFEYEKGTTPKLVHKPLLKGTRGKPIGVYAVAFYADNTQQFVYMDVDEVRHIKSKSKSRDKEGKIIGPWVTDELEMWKKTAVRRLDKYLPVTDNRLMRAFELDNESYSTGDDVTGYLADEDTVGEGKSRTQTLTELLEEAHEVEYTDIPPDE